MSELSDKHKLTIKKLLEAYILYFPEKQHDYMSALRAITNGKSEIANKYFKTKEKDE